MANQKDSNANASLDIFTVLARRRSVKHYTDQPVELDKILQILQAGTLAPSSGNIQNWSFIVITDTDKIRDLYHHTLDQEPFLSAMAAIIVCGDVEYAHSMYGMRGKKLYTIQNCAAAIQNIILAADAVGLGSLWVGAFDEDKVCSSFNIPDQRHRPQAIILLGYPAQEPEPKETKPLESVVFFNSFGNKVLRPHLVMYDWAAEWRLQAQNAKHHIAHSMAIAKNKHKLLSQNSKISSDDSNSDGANKSNSFSSSHSNSHDDKFSEDGSNLNAVQRARLRVRERLNNLKRDGY